MLSSKDAMTTTPTTRGARVVGMGRGSSRRGLYVSKLSLFLTCLVTFSFVSLYATVSLLNKYIFALQQREQAMLQPPAAAANYHNRDADKKMKKLHKRRNNSYPRIVINEGIKLVDSHRSNSNHDTKKQLKSIKPKRSEKTRRSYDYRDPLYEDDCIPMQSWQETSFPTCSSIHELDFYSRARTGEFQYYTSGGYNDLFTLEDTSRELDPKLAIKILQAEESGEYTDRNFDRVRRDAVILERATKSPYIMDIFGFCGFLVLVPLANGGSLYRALTKDPSPLQRLQYAYEAAAGVAAVHNIDGEKLSAVTQGDLKSDQYLFHDGILKLGDFNRGRFIRRNSTAPDTACTYTIGRNDAKYRSPEEYKYLPQTAAIDVWAVGSLIYLILHGYEVWDDTKTAKAQQYVMEGKLPEIDEKYKESDDPAIKAMLDAIDMCYIYDPEKRAKAWEVASFLEKKLEEIKKLRGV